MFCEQLRLYRHILRLTQKELGRLTGVSASAIGMYEQGRRLPGVKVYSRMRLLFARQGYVLCPPPDAPEGDTDSLRAVLRSMLKNSPW